MYCLINYGTGSRAEPGHRRHRGSPRGEPRARHPAQRKPPAPSGGAGGSFMTPRAAGRTSCARAFFDYHQQQEEQEHERSARQAEAAERAERIAAAARQSGDDGGVDLDPRRRRGAEREARPAGRAAEEARGVLKVMDEETTTRLERD